MDKKENITSKAISVIASEAKQSLSKTLIFSSRLLRRFAPRNDSHTILAFITCLFLILFSSFSFANNLTSRPEVQKFIDYTAKKFGYSSNYVRNILNRARYNPEVINRFNHPYEALPWTKYRSLFVTQERIDSGVKYWDRSNKLVAWEEKEYEVPGNVILAIIGIESKFGQKMGSFNELDTLTTLAFYNPSRAHFFQKELSDFIAMAHTYKFNPTAIYGSYAGAIGQCQFMPSSYLYYAVDFHGKGRPNLFSDKADVIFSVGNYLRQNGWERGEPIAVPAKITGHQYKSIVQTQFQRPRPPRMTLRHLKEFGVTPLSGYYNSNLMANLLALPSPHGTEYWLTFQNFYAITRYNESNLYAMAVTQLAQKLQQAWDAHQKIDNRDE